MSLPEIDSQKIKFRSKTGFCGMDSRRKNAYAVENYTRYAARLENDCVEVHLE